MSSAKYSLKASSTADGLARISGEQQTARCLRGNFEQISDRQQSQRTGSGRQLESMGKGGDDDDLRTVSFTERAAMRTQCKMLVKSSGSFHSACIHSDSHDIGPLMQRITHVEGSVRMIVVTMR